MLYHAGVPFLPGGYVGVDIFFVISGFLITSHLLQGLAAEGRIRFGDFYARRARRILPASFLVLALSLISALIWYPPLLMKEVWQGAMATALYIPNYLFATNGTNYLAETTPSLFQHYWSLGIEEQFYLVWPALLALGFGLLKTRRRLMGLVAALVVLSFVACVLLTFRSQPWAFFSLPTRAWELGIGGLVAFLLSNRPQPLTGPAAAIVGWLGLGVMLASVALFDDRIEFPGYWAAIPAVATAAVILAGASRPAFGPTRVLSLRFMLFIGAISYSLYLVHWPMLVIPQASIGYFNPLSLWVKLLIAMACVPVAWLLFKYVEGPARNWSWLTHARPRRTLLATATVTAVAIGLSSGIYLWTKQLPLATQVTVGAVAITAPPSPTAVVPADLKPSLRSAADDRPAIYDDGCHLDFYSTDSAGCVFGDEELPSIVLFGDSHAAQWFPALEKFAAENGYSLRTNTKSSCPSVSVDVIRDGVPYAECSSWRKDVIQSINDSPPALVIISNFGSAQLSERGDFAALWQAGLEKSLTAIDAPAVVVADTPYVGETSSVCLSSNLTTVDNCERSASFAFGSPARAAERSAALATSTPLVDLSAYMCGPEWCPPIIGNYLVYRDAHHITAEFSHGLEGVLAEELRPFLAETQK